MSATKLACLSVSGCVVPLPVFEALTFGRDEVGDAIQDLQRLVGADQLCLLSTCERLEIYAMSKYDVDPSAIATALARNRGVGDSTVREAATLMTGRQAAGHLFRVASGLRSFVLGESDIVGQVRTAGAASTAAGAGGLELDRLIATAVNTSRRVHRATSFGAAGRSVAAAAVRMAAGPNGLDLRDARVLLVGAGDVAGDVIDGAVRLGAEVAVCNRTRRRADRFAAAGARVLDIGSLEDELSGADVAIFATAAPHPLVTATQLERIRHSQSRPLLVIDLCVPRNVDAAVRGLSGVRLCDLEDLRAARTLDDGCVTRDVATAERIVEEELDRYERWLAGRSAAGSLRRLREDVDACVRHQVALATRGVPDDLHPVIAAAVARAVHQAAHGPTTRILEAAEAGDDRLVEVLAGLFAPSRPTPGTTDPGRSVAAPQVEASVA